MDDLKSINERLIDIDKTLVRNTVILEEHVRRTNLLEKRFHPIEEHVANLRGIVKFFKFLAILAAIAEVIRLLAV